MARLLIADDHSNDRYLLRAQLEPLGHSVREAVNGREALALALADPPDLVVSDVLMPELDGFGLCHEWHKHPRLAGIPFVFVSANYVGDGEVELAASAGADAFLQKPTLPGALAAKIDELLRSRPAKHGPGQTEAEFETHHLAAVNQKLLEKIAILRATQRGVIDLVSRLVEARDPYTAGHERRVGALAAAIGKELGLDDGRCEALDYCGQVHDIGKVSLPAEILVKPSRLTKWEFELVKSHTTTGHDLLARLDFPWPLADVVLHHHERLDGSGYPDGLTGEAISLECRIIAVADVVESMASHRPYRPSLGLDAALAEIERGAGRQFDAAAVGACQRLFREQGFALAD
jgi:response regulator RpfG family c-di-GMP phosphodiesterase